MIKTDGFVHILALYCTFISSAVKILKSNLVFVHGFVSFPSFGFVHNFAGNGKSVLSKTSLAVFSPARVYLHMTAAISFLKSKMASNLFVIANSTFMESPGTQNHSISSGQSLLAVEMIYNYEDIKISAMSLRQKSLLSSAVAHHNMRCHGEATE